MISTDALGIHSTLECECGRFAYDRHDFFLMLDLNKYSWDGYVLIYKPAYDLLCFRAPDSADVVIKHSKFEFVEQQIKEARIRAVMMS